MINTNSIGVISWNLMSNIGGVIQMGINIKNRSMRMKAAKEYMKQNRSREKVQLGIILYYISQGKILFLQEVSEHLLNLLEIKTNAKLITLFKSTMCKYNHRGKIKTRCEWTIIVIPRGINILQSGLVPCCNKHNIEKILPYCIIEHNNMKILLCSIHIPWDSIMENVHTFFKKLQSIMDRNKVKHFVLGGDWNRDPNALSTLIPSSFNYKIVAVNESTAHMPWVPKEKPVDYLLVSPFFESCKTVLINALRTNWQPDTTDSIDKMSKLSMSDHSAVLTTLTYNIQVQVQQSFVYKSLICMA